LGWVFRDILSGLSFSSGYKIHPHALPIESSEINSHSYPQLSIDANQIKWIKVHFLILDFHWCPIEVMFTLPIKWTSIGSLGWFALTPRTSLMKCEASYLRRGWVERNSFPSWPNSELFIWPPKLHILFH
jgi:hypothetical protein